jgi:hypothetical protein
MIDPIFNLRMQARGWLVDNEKTQARLSKLAGLSESFISDLLSGNCTYMSLPNYTRLQAVVRSPPVNLNQGCKIVKMQCSGKRLKGILELNREDIDKTLALSIEKDKRETQLANQTRHFNL